MKRLTLIIAAAILLFGCSGRSENNPETTPATMEDYTGKPVSDYYSTGSYDLVVLNYWASFCAPCKEEMIDLSRLYDTYRDRDVLILGVDTDPADKKDLVEKIAVSLGVTYPILYGAEAFFNNEKIIGYPTTFIIKDGVVAEKIEGKRDYDFFTERLEHHLASVDDTMEQIDSVIEQPRYTLVYTFTGHGDGGSVLTIRLAPKAGFHLNGPGYPPLTVTISAGNGLTVEPEEYSFHGIQEGQTMTMEFLLSGEAAQGPVVTCSLSLIACDKDTCSLIDEEIEIKP